MASPAAVKKVLVPITEGSEPVEAFVPIAVLRRAGADVTVAAAGAGASGLRVHAMYGVTVVADASVADCADASYDLVALPGGVPGADNLGGCAALESIVRRHALGGGLYAAICAAPPLALARWGLLNGVKATAHPAFVDKFPAEVAAVDANVVVDGRVVTGSGPAPAMEFALALVEQLYGKDKVDEIAKPMMVRYEPGYAFKELNTVQWQCSGTPKVLIPVANGSEEMEVLVTIDVLRRAKADVVVASAEAGAEVVVARHGTRIVADAPLDDAASGGQKFDLIIVPASCRSPTLLGWHARREDAGRHAGARGAAEGAGGGGQGVRRHRRRHGAGAGAARPRRGQEGDDVRVHGGPAGRPQRVREQGGGGREPGHEQEPRHGHGVRARRRGEAARPRGGAGGGGSPALPVTEQGPRSGRSCGARSRVPSCHRIVV